MSDLRITANGGSKHINSADGAQTLQGLYAFIVQEDTVITVLAGGATSTATGTNFLTAQGLSGKTLKQGALIMVPDGFVINSITLSSGSIIAYKPTTGSY